MRSASHSMFIVFLFLIGGIALAAMSFHGCEYYGTSLADRPFRNDYISMKPSGTYSHGLGITGSLMIIVGVSMYSTRKRVKALWSLGRLSIWLEVHIFLCLLGPILVLYHTTFKVGGIAAIALWSMLSVATSGLIGRFLYIQIPRNLNGTKLTLAEIDTQLRNAAIILQRSAVGNQILGLIEKSFSGITEPAGIAQTFRTLLHLQRVKISLRHSIIHLIGQTHVPRPVARELKSTATARISLAQRSLVLAHVEPLFYYWHAIHLPFTIIMFIALAAHVGMSIYLGYTWKF